MITGSITFLLDKNQNYNTEFRLFPKSERQPLFIGRAVDRFSQTKWLSEYGSSSDYSFKMIKQRTNTIGMLEGTPFKIELRAFDPTNLYNITDDKNIIYSWKKDGSVLFEYNNLNNLKGTSTIIITSESCTRDISGIYELDATNKFGTTTSEQIVIDVVNRKYHPYLYKNLIVNGCGDQGAAAWTTDSDITVRNLSTSNRHQWSIPHAIYHVGDFGPYHAEFDFSGYDNETKLVTWFDQAKVSSVFDINQISWAGYNRWIVKSFPPNLVATDGVAGGAQASFFPSWDYLDAYNKNENLYKLGNIINNSKTYITRDKIKFAIYGGKAKSIAYQDISLVDIAGMIDGDYYGIDKVVAHFFAYVGIGISNYKLEYVDASTGATVEDNLIPISEYKYKVSSLQGRPSFIPLHPSASIYNTFAASSYNDATKAKFSRKIKPGTTISLTPVCYDKTEIRLDFLNENGTVIGSETVPGPTEKDIWAVKEKFFIPYYIGNLYGWTTNATSQEFYIYSQSYTSIDAIRGIDDQNKPIKDANAAWIKKYYYQLYDVKWDMFGPNSTQYSITTSDEATNVGRKNDIIKNFGFDPSFVEKNGTVTLPTWHVEGATMAKFDNGAAAFFGINRDVVVPKGTRTIRVNIVFSHTSEAISDSNPRIKSWRSQTIYFDAFTKDEVSKKTVEYGNPRCAVTAAHLSLHPNYIEISEDYNTYQVNLSGSVWYQELLKLNGGPNTFRSIVSQSYNVDNLRYVASVTSLPQIPSLNGTVFDIIYPDLAIQVNLNNPLLLESGSGAPVIEPQVTGSIDIEPNDEQPEPEDIPEATSQPGG